MSFGCVSHSVFELWWDDGEREASVRAVRRYERGISLVELLIAMALGLMLSLGVIQVFDSHRVSYRTQEALSQVQESARVAMAVLSRDIRLAGFWGCHGQS